MSKIILFGVPCVGAKTLAKGIADRLNYKYYDTFIEQKKECGTVKEFQQKYPWVRERHEHLADIIINLLKKEEDMVIACSMIWWKVWINRILRQDVIPVYIVDRPENIFERITFYDDNDELIPEDGYKELHKSHYMREIKSDLKFVESHNLMKDVKLVFNIEGDNIEVATNRLLEYLKRKNII